MSTATITTHGVVVDPENRRRWFVVTPEGVKVEEPVYRTKTEAVAAAEAADAAGTEQSFTTEQLAAMDTVTLINSAKPEREALAAWKKAGRQGDKPATPVIDFMSQVSRPKLVGSPKATKVKESPRTPEQQAELESIMKRAAKDGNKWHQAAKALTAAEIPTSRGGGWYYSTVQGLAKQMGLG